MPSSGKVSPNCIKNSEKGKIFLAGNREGFIDEQIDPEDNIVISRANWVLGTWGVLTEQGEKCLAKADSLCVGVVEDMTRKIFRSEQKTLRGSLVSILWVMECSHPSNQYSLSNNYVQALC